MAKEEKIAPVMLLTLYTLSLPCNATYVDDIDAAHTYMSSKGVIPTTIQTRNDGQKAFYINDPDGNRSELCTKSGFGVLV